MIANALQILGAVWLIVAAFLCSVALGFAVAGVLFVIAGVVREVVARGSRSTAGS